MAVEQALVEGSGPVGSAQSVSLRALPSGHLIPDSRPVVEVLEDILLTQQRILTCLLLEYGIDERDLDDRSAFQQPRG